MRDSTAKGLTLLTAMCLAGPVWLNGGCGASEVPDTPTPTPTLLPDVEDIFQDLDGDGSIARDDCDDTDADTFPGATEECDGKDNDCDLTIDEGFDRDSDGHLDAAACAALGGDDCDDTTAGIAPGEDETCDGVDEDCDAIVDESPVDGTTYWTDPDGDSFGAPEDALTACTQPEGTVTNDLDCDGQNGDISPSAREECDAIDNDCDGFVDEAVLTAFYLDEDGDGYGADSTVIESCASPGEGYVVVGGDCDDSATNVNPGQSEFCDGIDNNCDGIPDDNSAANADLYYEDKDGDGYGLTSTTDRFCEPRTGWSAVGGDCNDMNAAISPGAEEICGDAIDQNCDGVKPACN